MKPPRRVNYRHIDRIQSQRISKSLSELGDSAHRRRGSGSKWYAKGDVISKLFLIEGKDKARPSKQRTIYKETFDKIKREAIDEGKIPVYTVGFGDGRDFMILEDIDFYHIVDRMITAEKRLQELEGE